MNCSWAKIWGNSCWSVVTRVTAMTTIHSMLRLVRLPIISCYSCSISGSLWFMWNLIIELCWLLIIRMNTRRRLSWGWRELSCICTVDARPHFNILRTSARRLSGLYSCCPRLVENFVCYVLSESSINRKTSSNHRSLSCLFRNITYNPCVFAGLTYSLLWILEGHHVHCYALHVRHI